MISERGVSVWLNAPLDVLWNRVKHKDTRPLLRTPHPYETLKDIFEARVPIYGLADLTAEANPTYSIEDMTGEVIQVLSTRPDVLEASK